METEDYDPKIDLWKLLDTPNSLRQLDDLLNYTSGYKRVLDNSISLNITEYKGFQEMMGDETKLENLETDIVDLISSFTKTWELADDTEKAIQSMTGNIRKLDNCKRNLTLSMTVLKRLQMLIGAFYNLTDLLKNNAKNYSMIYQLLSVVLELMQHFQSYKSIDEINDLNRTISRIKNQIVDGIFSDFEDLSSNPNPELLYACKTLDSLGPAYRSKLINWYVNLQLKEVSSIFGPTEEAGSLSNLGRRFIFFKRLLMQLENQTSKVFPKDWKIELVLAQKFCEATKSDLNRVIARERASNTSGSLDTTLLMNSLEETLDFEAHLNQKFKYYDDSNIESTKAVPVFDRMISEVFEPQLQFWMDYQDSKLDERFSQFLTPDNLLKKTGPLSDDKSVLDDSSINVLDSSTELFRVYRQLLVQLSKLSHGEPLLNLSNMFVKYLYQYKNQVLQPLIPPAKKISSLTTEEASQVLPHICLILNTADYCCSTISQLEERLSKLIEDPKISERMGFDPVKESYLVLINSCLNLLLLKLDRDFDMSWREFTNENWKNLTEVTGESRFLTSVKRTVMENCTVLFKNFDKERYIRNFTDRVIELIITDFTAQIVKIIPIHEIVAEQLLLDLQSLRSLFLDIPNLSPKQTELTNTKPIVSSRMFKKFVDTNVNNLERILKMVMTRTKPFDNFVQSYFMVIGDKKFDNFFKILILNGTISLPRGFSTAASHHASLQNERLKYQDIFNQQLLAYEDGDTEQEQLEESFAFLDNFDIDRYRKNLYKPTVDTVPQVEGNVTFSPNSTTSPTAKTISNFFNNIGHSNTDSIDDQFIDSGINSLAKKIDKQAIINTKENLEKNLARTFSGDHKLNINENFKNFSKLFGKKN
ncbi:hypothetical protein LJB42_002988 [Komagataella kurtzmanii]|nr:hypothetical protein LJB42_002988 [Komagataella kurtzmanii]